MFGFDMQPLLQNIVDISLILVAVTEKEVRRLEFEYALSPADFLQCTEKANEAEYEKEHAHFTRAHPSLNYNEQWKRPRYAKQAKR